MRMTREGSLNKMMGIWKMMNNRWIMILLFKMNSWSINQWNYNKLKINKDFNNDHKLQHCSKHQALQIHYFLDQNHLNNKILIFLWEIIKTKQNSRSEITIKINFISNNNTNKLFILSNQETAIACIQVYNLINLEIIS